MFWEQEVGQPQRLAEGPFALNHADWFHDSIVSATRSYAPPPPFSTLSFVQVLSRYNSSADCTRAAVRTEPYKSSSTGAPSSTRTAVLSVETLGGRSSEWESSAASRRSSSAASRHSPLPPYARCAVCPYAESAMPLCALCCMPPLCA